MLRKARKTKQLADGIDSGQDTSEGDSEIEDIGLFSDLETEGYEYYPFNTAVEDSGYCSDPDLSSNANKHYSKFIIDELENTAHSKAEAHKKRRNLSTEMNQISVVI